MAFAVLLVATLAGCSSDSGAKHARPATDRPSPTLDSARAGPEQVVVQVPLPPDFIRAMGDQPAIGATVVPGTEFGFTVNGSPLIGVEEDSTRLVLPGHPVSSARTYLSARVVYVGTGGLNGTGYDGGSSQLGATGSAASPVQVIPDWPTTGHEVLAWLHLPTSIKYVTYSYQGGDRTWVTPTQGTALLSVPRPAVYDGDYATWHTAPFALLRAFDASGHLVEQQYAPRISGDDVPKVP